MTYEASNEVCVCGHFDTSHDIYFPNTGVMRGCMEMGCPCCDFTPSEFADEPYEDMLAMIDQELRCVS